VLFFYYSARIIELPSTSGPINELPSPVADPVEIAVTRSYQNLRKGQIAFDAPNRMRVGDEEIVEARISDDLQRDLKAGLGKNAISARINVSFLMKVKLDGGSKFTIKSLSEEVQALPKGNVAKWHWNVTPTESGKQEMLLMVYAIVPIQ
jgi:hypothetical protein